MDLIFFLQKDARAKKARIHFFRIYESPKDTNSIFLQAKNAQKTQGYQLSKGILLSEDSYFHSELEKSILSLRQ